MFWYLPIYGFLPFLTHVEHKANSSHDFSLNVDLLSPLHVESLEGSIL